MFAFLPILAQASATPVPSTPANAAGGAAVIGAGLLALVGGVVVQIVAYWIASKMLVSKNNGFGKALKLWLMILVGMIGSLVLAVIVIGVGSAFHNTPVVVVGFIGFALLALYVVFSTTMKVYEIGFLRAFALLLIAGVIEILVQFGALQMLKHSSMGPAIEAKERQNAVLWNAAFAQLQGAPPTATASSAPAPASDAQIAADRTQPVAVRRAALQRWRDALEARRVALQPQDQAAIAAYKQEAQRYGELFHELDAGAPKP